MPRDSLDNSTRARDVDLVARVRAGDASAFDQLFCEYYPPLVRFVMAMGQDRDVAEDAVSDVFTAIWRGRERWNVGQASVRTYLFTAVRNQALKVVRHGNVRRAHATVQRELPEAAASPPSAALEARETYHRLISALRALSERRRLALHLRFNEALTYREIGDVLSISKRSAEELIERSLRALRRLLDGDT